MQRNCKTKVMENKSNNDRMYAQREILGVDEYSVIHRFTRVVLISENIVKFKFNENWDPQTKKYKENVTGLIDRLSINPFNCWDEFAKTLVQ